VMDLMREEKITKNPKVAKVLSILVPVFGLRRVAAEGDALVLELIPRREGVSELYGRARDRVRSLIP